MGARYKYYTSADFRGGFCLEYENSSPNQLLTARNVWAPEGRLETRPGFVGISYLGEPFTINSAPNEQRELVADGTFDTTLEIDTGSPNRPTKHRHHVYFSDPLICYYSLAFFYTPDNDNLGYSVEYSGPDGSWLPLNALQTLISGSSSGGVYVVSDEAVGEPYLWDATNLPLGVRAATFTFVPPLGWTDTNTTGVGIPQYGIRIAPYATQRTYPTDGASYYGEFQGNLGATAGSSPGPNRGLKALYAPQFSSGKRYIYGGRAEKDFSTWDNKTRTIADWGFINTRTIDAVSTSWDDRYVTLLKTAQNEPASYANVPLFDECYVAYDYTVTRHKFDGTNEVATIEDRDFAVGGTEAGKDRADYHPDFVATFNSFPRCKYITFFGGKLWAVNIEDAEVQVRWSAPEPYHNVWPATNVANIMEDDNSPITGVSSLGENLVIFKNDSIWQMVYSGESDNGEDVFVPKKVTSTVGCVSNSSIVRTPLGLIFLAEDGIYLFTGSPTPEKLSGGIDALFNRVYAPRRRFAAAVHYKTKNCYLLSLSVDNSTVNNLVLCYDYKHGAWYEWAGIPAEVWMPDEGPSDDERIYFGDSKSNLYELFGQHDDGRAITSTVVTHRYGFGDFTTKTLRELRINSSNDVNSIDIEVLRNDDEEGYGKSGALSLTDAAETSWPVTAAGDYSYIIADATALPTATGSISTAQFNLPGDRHVHIGYTENIGVVGGVAGTGGVTSMSFTLEGFNEAGENVTEIVSLSENAPFGTSVNKYASVTSLELTTLVTVSSGTADAEYFVGYGAGSDTPKWSGERRRERRWTCRENGEWFQVKLTSAQWGRKMKLHRLSLGYIPLGAR